MSNYRHWWCFPKIKMFHNGNIVREKGRFFEKCEFVEKSHIIIYSKSWILKFWILIWLLSWNDRTHKHFLESEQRFFVAFMIQKDQKIVSAVPDNFPEREHSKIKSLSFHFLRIWTRWFILECSCSLKFSGVGATIFHSFHDPKWSENRRYRARKF